MTKVKKALDDAHNRSLNPRARESEGKYGAKTASYNAINVISAHWRPGLGNQI